MSLLEHFSHSVTTVCLFSSLDCEHLDITYCFTHLYCLKMQQNVYDTMILSELILYLVCPLLQTWLWMVEIQNWRDPNPAFREFTIQRRRIWVNGPLQKHCASSRAMFAHGIMSIQVTQGIQCLLLLNSQWNKLRWMQWLRWVKNGHSIWLSDLMMLVQRGKAGM